MSLQQSSGAPLERVESYQWPAAHVGHLNDVQRAALDQFKDLCAAQGYYNPPTRTENGTTTTTTPASHDEETLLRYLRARKFVPHEAWVQFQATEDWRRANDLEGLYEGIDVDEYERTRRLYPQWTGRRDRRGIPVYVYQIGDVDVKATVGAQGSGGGDKDGRRSSSFESNNNNNNTTTTTTTTTNTTNTNTSATQTPRKMLRLFALYENLCRFVLPLCSALPDRPARETPISQSSNLVDLSRVSLMKFWSLRTHMSAASELATAHYPETLDRIFVVGAPGFFPTVWEWVKKWFDPITVSKIFILNDKTMTETLEKFIAIEDIPVKYGGKLEWKFGDMPALDPKIVDALEWREETFEKGGRRTWPKGPIKWQYDEHGDLVAMAIGSENGKARRRVLAGLRPQAGVATLALSPGRASTSDQVAHPNIILAKTSTTTATGTDNNTSLRSSLESSTPAIPAHDTARSSTVPTLPLVPGATASMDAASSTNHHHHNHSTTASQHDDRAQQHVYAEPPVQDDYALLAQRSRDDVPSEEQQQHQQHQQHQQSSSLHLPVRPAAEQESHGRLMPQTMSMWRGDGASALLGVGGNSSDGNGDGDGDVPISASTYDSNGGGHAATSTSAYDSNSNSHAATSTSTSAYDSNSYAANSTSTYDSNSHAATSATSHASDYNSTSHNSTPLSNEPLGPTPPSSFQPTTTTTTTTSSSSSSLPSTVGDTPHTGTSPSRFTQQASTHAAGNSAGPIPKLDSRGEEHFIIEPGTVGQAPKHHDLPPSPDQPAAPGIVETAREYASAALQQAAHLPSTVLAAVGLGGGGAKHEGHGGREESPAEEERRKTEAEEKEKAARRLDPEIDRLDEKVLEAFLRSQTVSTRKK